MVRFVGVSRRCAVIVCALVASGIAAGEVAGADAVRRVDIEGTAEIQDDWAVAADRSDQRTNDMTLSIEPTITVQMAPRITLVAEPVLESLSESDASKERNFGDLGLSVETLFLTYSAARYGAYGGKFNASFGKAWDLAAGLYGTDFAEDYEITERLGIGGYLSFGSRDRPPHRLSASTFLADTTLLSESAFNNRGRAQRQRGGPSNTRFLSSFVAAIDGPLPWMNTGPGPLDLGYHTGVAYQRGGDGDPEDEISAAFASYGSLSITANTTLDAVVELVVQSGALAQTQDRAYLTTSAALTRGPWTLSAAYSRRSIKPHSKAVSGPASNDDLAQLSFGFMAKHGVTIEAGYRYSQESKTDKHVLGVLLSYDLGLLFR